MELRRGEVPRPEELAALYGSVGWTAYTDDVARLHRAVARSTEVVTAWEDGELVGLARALTDGETILYLQDLLVRPDRQRHGTGRALLEDLLARYPHVRQKVLLTDTEERQEAFYRALGYRPAAEVDGGPLVAFVRLDA